MTISEVWDRRIVGSLRHRRLSGDRRAGSWARSKARRSQREFVRHHWKALALVAVSANVVGDLCVLFVGSQFARGLVIGGLAVATLSMLWSHVVAVTGTAPVMMGDLAEQWTAGELRKLRPTGWRLINRVSFRTWDIDHVLLGPAGLVAVETKWSAEWVGVVAQRRLRSAVQRAAVNMWDLQWWHELKVLELPPPRALIVVWGKGASEAAQRVRATAPDRCDVVAGQDLAYWAGAMPSASVPAETIDAAWTAIDAHCRRRDEHAGEASHVPASVGGVALLGVGSLLAASLGFFAATAWLSELERLGCWTVLGLLLLVPGPLLDQRRIRTISWGWTFGAAATVPLLVWAGVSALRG